MSVILFSILIAHFALCACADTPLLAYIVPSNYADLYDAKCLDGSPPAVYVRHAPVPSRNWQLFLQGGGWCFTTADCASRAKGSLGSTKADQPGDVFYLGGQYSANATINPDLYTYNIAYLRYCDGGSFASNRSGPVDGLFYRGRGILQAQLAYLRAAHGLRGVDTLIISGGSAGALAAYYNADLITASVEPVKSLLMPDAGLFMKFVGLNGHNWAASFTRANDTLWHLVTAPSCMSNASALVAGDCLFAESVIPYIGAHISVYILNSAYDFYQWSNVIGLHCLGPNCTAPSERAAITAFQSAMLDAVVRIATARQRNGSPSGAFITNCLVHEQNAYYCDNQVSEGTVINCFGWRDYLSGSGTLGRSIAMQSAVGAFAAGTTSRADRLVLPKKEVGFVPDASCPFPWPKGFPPNGVPGRGQG